MSKQAKVGIKLLNFAERSLKSVFGKTNYPSQMLRVVSAPTRIGLGKAQHIHAQNIVAFT
jgi:hypothetical protein